MSAVVAISQSVVVNAFAAVARPSADHSILAALKPIILALHNASSTAVLSVGSLMTSLRNISAAEHLGGVHVSFQL